MNLAEISRQVNSLLDGTVLPKTLVERRVFNLCNIYNNEIMQ